MSTQSQVAANRSNSSLSTGPRTDAGRTTSAQNAVKHGLRSTRVVLLNEDEIAYQALLDRLTEEHKPVGLTESTLVAEIAAATWRLDRARTIETETFDRQFLTTDANDSATPLADAFSAASSEIDKIRRYAVSIERAWYKALAELRKVQAARLAAEQTQAREEGTAEIREEVFDKYFAAHCSLEEQGAAGKLGSFGNSSNSPAAGIYSRRNSGQ